MIIDTHCHVDMLNSPDLYLAEKEKDGDFTLGMTNLPSHFVMGLPHFNKLRKSRLALGFHPQLVHEHISEIDNWKKLIPMTSYIGEVGLDFSRDFITTKDRQLEYFDYICQCLKGEKKIISVHSRKAERDVLSILKRYNVKNVIFHWYSGPVGLIDEIIGEGYYFSINEAMTLSENGRRIISRIPLNKILTESDAPYNKKGNIMAALNNLLIDESIVYENFQCLLKTIK